MSPYFLWNGSFISLARLVTHSQPLSHKSVMSYVAIVKALYDYEAQDPAEELSFKEDQIVYVIDKEDDQYVVLVVGTSLGMVAA